MCFPRSLSTHLRVWFLTLLSSFVFVVADGTPDASAHEIQPAVLDFEVVDGTMRIRLVMTLESAVAGLDLQGVFDTNDTDQAEEYDRLRELDPVQMDNAFRRYWPTLQEKLTFRAGDEDFKPELLSVEIPEVGNVELPRSSLLTMEALPPEGSEPFVIGWTGDLGPLVVRDLGSEDGFTAFLQNGALTLPIPRSDAENCLFLGFFCR